MKNEENQGFTSFDFITMLFSFAVIAAVTAPIIKKNFETDQNVQVARNQLGELGHTLMDPVALNIVSMNSEPKSQNDRSVASIHEDNKIPSFDIEDLKNHVKKNEWEGQIGKDPWGNPYHFAFLKNQNGVVSHVAVWSDGPNHTAETSVRDQMGQKPGVDSIVANPMEIKFQGDDVGAVYPIR
jgi:hypothetical protein